MIVDNKNNKTIVVETTPAQPPAKGKPGTPAKRLQISTNDHSLLDGLERGKAVKISIEQ